MVEQIADIYPNRFAPLTMHVNGDGYTIPWAQDRLDIFYGVAGAVPTFMVDALWNCQAPDYQYYVEQELANPTDTTLELSGSPVGGSTWDITARVCRESGSARQMRVFTAATLDHHPSLPSYSTNVLMQKIEEADINLAGGECEDVTTRFTFDSTSMANSSDIVIIAWAQKPAAVAPTNVYQAGIMRWPFPAGNELTTIEVAPANATVTVGGQVEFTATGKDQSGEPFPLENPTWSLGSAGAGSGSFDPVSGSETTTFTATRAGTRQVFCNDGDVSGAALVTIEEAPQLAAIEIDPASATVAVDGEVMFTATGKDQYGEDFALTDPEWSVSGDGDGLFDPTAGVETTFTAGYPGSAVVTCTQGDVSGTAGLEITGDDPVLTTITISPETAQLRVGDDLEFTAGGSDQYGRAFALADPAWRTEGDGDGVFDPTSGNATTTFTASATGSSRILCSEDGVEGEADVVISPEGLAAPRRVQGRVSP